MPGNVKNSSVAGDDLDDGLDYSYDGEGEVSGVLLEGSDNDDSETVSTEVTLKKSAKKRTAQDDDESDADEQEPVAASDKKTDKKKQKQQPNKKKQKSSQLAEKKQAKTVSMADQKSSLATMDPSMIADYIANKVRFKNKDLSTIELNEILIPESRIKDTSDFVLKRDDENFSKFVEFCKSFFHSSFSKHCTGLLT